MTDPIIFKTNGKEGFCIPFSPSSFPYVGSKCPETKLEVKEMTEFQPKPQTPEQVADGLRNAFRQAMKDGVMDATPYLKQMTFKSDIEKTEAEIKMLQSKLSFLEELEKTKPPTLYEMFYNKGLVSICDTVCDIVADWLPDEDDGDDRYACGWNDCVEKLKLRLK